MAVDNELIVFHHIPKTGGTSLINMLRGRVSRQHAVHYAVERNKFTYRNIATDIKYQTPARLRPIIQKLFVPFGTPESVGQAIDESIPVPDHIQMIEGHFYADRLGVLDIGRNVLRLALIREPLERALSQYDHYVRSSGIAVFTNNDASNLTSVSIEDYLLAPENTNLQSRMLVGRNEYTLGCTERLDVIADLIGGVSVRHDNMGYNRTVSHQLDPILFAEFRDRNQADYDLFDIVMSGGGTYNFADVAS